MKYTAGDGYRLLKKKETVPQGAQRKVANDPTASWVPTRAAGKVLDAVPQDGFIYRVPKPLKVPNANVQAPAKVDKGVKPGEAILALLKGNPGKSFRFQEIHEHLCGVLGDKDRDEKATRVALQLLKDTGRVKVASVTYTLEELEKGVIG